MWDQLSQLDGKLQFQTIQPTQSTQPRVAGGRPWVWLSVEGGEIPITGTEATYPESERLRSFALKDALEHLQEGFAVRCVAGPSGTINLGESFYAPLGSSPWYRWHGDEWKQIKLSISSSDLIRRISGWSEDSRWRRVDRPTS